MDPDACLALLLDAFRDGDREAAYQHLEDLLDWCAKGGFLPKDVRPDTSDIPEAGEDWFKRARLVTPHVVPSSRERAVTMVAEAGAAMVLAATDDEIMAAAAASGEDIDLLITRVQAMIERNTPDQG